jgi:hypothetical protein
VLFFESRFPGFPGFDQKERRLTAEFAYFNDGSVSQEAYDLVKGVVRHHLTLVLRGQAPRGDGNGQAGLRVRHQAGVDAVLP